MDTRSGQGKRGSQASSAAPGAREHMGESADPFRLAIGVFHEPERLESAICDLFADNVDARDMCLVGTRQAFDRLLPASVAELGRAQLAGQLQPLSPLAADPEVVATSGDLLSTLLRHAEWQGGASTLGSSPLQELLARSSDHIGHGAGFSKGGNRGARIGKHLVDQFRMRQPFPCLRRELLLRVRPCIGIVEIEKKLESQLFGLQRLSNRVLQVVSQSIGRMKESQANPVVSVILKNLKAGLRLTIVLENCATLFRVPKK